MRTGQCGKCCAEMKRRLNISSTAPGAPVTEAIANPVGIARGHIGRANHFANAEISHNSAVLSVWIWGFHKEYPLAFVRIFTLARFLSDNKRGWGSASVDVAEAWLVNVCQQCPREGQSVQEAYFVVSSENFAILYFLDFIS